MIALLEPVVRLIWVCLGHSYGSAVLTHRLLSSSSICPLLGISAIPYLPLLSRWCSIPRDLTIHVDDQVSISPIHPKHIPTLRSVARYSAGGRPKELAPSALTLLPKIRSKIRSHVSCLPSSSFLAPNTPPQKNPIKQTRCIESQENRDSI